MAKVVNMHEAKTHLSKIVEEAMNGITVYLARNGTPVVRLVPLVSEQLVRPVGLHEGAYSWSEQDTRELLASEFTTEDLTALETKPLEP